MVTGAILTVISVIFTQWKLFSSDESDLFPSTKGTALDAIFLYQILGIAHKADVSTLGSAHHPNLSHMLYGCWGYWGYILY